MSDFKNQLDQLAAKKAAADAEAKQIEDEKRTKWKNFTATTQARIDAAFDPAMTDLADKLGDLGLTRAPSDGIGTAGFSLSIFPSTGVKTYSRLMVIPRSEAEGVEVIRGIRNQPTQSQKVHPDLIDVEWAEKLLLNFVSAVLSK